jgi:predicted nucleic-acid-binding protein
MKALDTNLLVRFLVKDDRRQFEAVMELLRKAGKREESYWVSTAVLLEINWVLSRSYGYSRDEILYAFGLLEGLAVLEFECPELLPRLLLEAERANADLADLMIGLCGAAAGCETTLTFGRAAAKSRLFAKL